ncbi:hypothetical protein CGP82_05710 [Campylobacter sp. LR185c]|nr:hypothetical protein CGP82_05710 [Campylobacter sp. LR185c]
MAHILDKHPNFDLNLIEKIIKNGKIVKNNNTNTIWANFEGKIYKLGLSNGWKGKGKNNWIITSYEATRESDKTFGDALFTDKRPLSNLDKIDYNTKLKNNQLNEPLKEFGKNYAEFYHNSKGAIEKLLKEKKGQVAGAFWRDDLGDIDLVWGNSNFGLKHIIEQRTKQWGEKRALNFINEIPTIIQNSQIYKKERDRIELITNKYTIILGLRKDNKFILSALRDRRNLKRLETTQTGVAGSFTDKTLGFNHLLSNQQKNSNTKLKNNQLNEPLKEFGKNYAELYHNSKGAIEKLLKENELSKKANSTKNNIIKENYSFETHLNTLTQNSLKNQTNEPLIISFKNENRLIKDLRKDLKENLMPLINMQIINKETNLKGIITQKEVNKISSSKEIQKSLNNGFSKKEHFEVAKKIKNLFENATLIQTHKDIKNKENILLIYKFIKDLIINNKNAKAKITLFEKIQGKNKIYTIELDSLENPTP